MHHTDVTLQVADSDATLEAPDPESQQSRSILVVWRQPPRPLNEEDRWDTLCQMQILDTVSGCSSSMCSSSSRATALFGLLSRVPMALTIHAEV